MRGMVIRFLLGCEVAGECREGESYVNDDVRNEVYSDERSSGRERC